MNENNNKDDENREKKTRLDNRSNTMWEYIFFLFVMIIEFMNESGEYRGRC